MDSPFQKVPDSYSRKIDSDIAKEELPYGYTNSPPPYDHQNSEAVQAYKAQKSHYKPYKKA